MTELIKNKIERHQRTAACRFSGASDGLRLATLGLLLIALGALALADTLAAVPFPGHFGGSSALFGGIAISLFILKIGKGVIYTDWIIFAASSVGIGMILYADEHIACMISLSIVCICLEISAAMRLWIGSTASPHIAANWIFASGYIGALGGLWIISAWLLGMPALPAIVIALDCMFQGISITGFGASLRATG